MAAKVCAILNVRMHGSPGSESSALSLSHHFASLQFIPFHTIHPNHDLYQLQRILSYSNFFLFSASLKTMFVIRIFYTLYSWQFMLLSPFFDVYFACISALNSFWTQKFSFLPWKAEEATAKQLSKSKTIMKKSHKHMDFLLVGWLACVAFLFVSSNFKRWTRAHSTGNK